MVRVYMYPGGLPRALVVLPSAGGLPWCGWSGVPCGGRRGDDRAGPQPFPLVRVAGLISEEGRGLGRSPKVFSPSRFCFLVQLAVVRLRQAQSHG